MKVTLGWVTSYAVGILLLLLSLVLTYFSLWGLIAVGFSLLILPIVRNTLATQADIEFSRGAVIAISIVAVISLFVIVSGVAVGAILDHDAVEVNGTSVSFNGESSTEQDASAVELRTQDTSFSDSSYSITTQWNATTQRSIDTEADDSIYYASEPKEKYLIIRLRITNTGNTDFEPNIRLYRVVIDGIEYHPRRIGNSRSSLEGVTQSPGSTREGWIAFTVPENATEGELITYQEAYRNERVSVKFEHNSNITIGIPERE